MSARGIESTMKTAVAVVLAIFVSYALSAEETYPTTWDNVNLRDVFTNDRLVNQYITCLLEDNAKCSPDAATLKKYLPEAIQSGCAKCTDKQREGAHRAIKCLVKTRPESWELLVKKYDKDGTYLKEHEEELEKIKNDSSEACE
uniref:Chemosensory protein 4 n=1 Tax=Subpsaltria yangi TaxID=1195109 RepID=A0A385IUQ2_9HEMI|nr:chemosensory protein 4 [Subpsaltria yangi]AXY87878.1 chemosensory protein 9 [Subpsaltria yangi]